MRFTHLPRLAVCLLSIFTFTQVSAKEVPILTSRVNDYANILSPTTLQALETMLKEHEDSTSNQVVVLTVQSLEGEVLEEYSIKVVEAWKLGTKKNDNGVLLLVAKDDRKVRIEVGDGLEGVLNDGKAGWIIRNLIVPSFKEGNFDAGVMAGVAAMLKVIQGEYTIDEESATESSDEEIPLGMALGISAFFLLVVGMFTLIGVFTEGAASWFLFFFLIPFWTAFPMAVWGVTAGSFILGSYLAFFLGSKIYFAHTEAGKKLMKKWSKKLGSGRGGSSYGSSGSSWSSSGSSSSSSSSFSGGGGSFSGGGSSGSW
jgi:uncharacterized protein